MKITRLVVYQVDLPLTEPYFLSGGRLKFEQLDSTFVKIETDEGVEGWGEGCPWGHTYLPAHGPGVRAGLQTIAPSLIGHDPCALGTINRIMDVSLPGHPYVKSAIDMACWDIFGKATGMPLWRLFGAEAAEPVPLYSSISTGEPEQMIELLRQASAKGYRTHSAKIGGSNTAADISRIEALSATLPENEHITFDINRAWTPATAIKVLNSISSGHDAFLAQPWIEQPCESLEQCAHVASRVLQPLMLDECLQKFSDHLVAWRDGACEGVKIKLNRLGGLTKAKRVRDFGLGIGWQMNIAEVGGSALSDTAAIHLAASTPDSHRLASWLCNDLIADDPVPGQGSRNINGFATPPSEPGIGVVPNADSMGQPSAVYQ